MYFATFKFVLKMSLLFSLLIFLQVASTSRSLHKPAIDFISNSFPNVVKKSPELLGALDKFYTLLNECFYKAVSSPETAHLFERVDTMMLYALLIKEYPSLHQHFEEIQKLLMNIREYVDNSNILNMVLNMDSDENQYTFFGYFLRSLIFRTDVIIKSGKSVSLSVLNRARSVNMMVNFLNVSPNTFYSEHLLELFWVYKALDKREDKLGVMHEINVDMQSTFFSFFPDTSLMASSSVSYIQKSPPKFIRDHLKPNKDFIMIDGEQCLSMYGYGALAHRYWNALKAFRIRTKCYDITLPLADNMKLFRARISKLNESWLLSGRIVVEELRNLCCAYDFLYYYSKLVGAEYDFGPLKKTLLTITQHDYH